MCKVWKRKLSGVIGLSEVRTCIRQRCFLNGASHNGDRGNLDLASGSPEGFSYTPSPLRTRRGISQDTRNSARSIKYRERG
jgi:hypothetical protein